MQRLKIDRDIRSMSEFRTGIASFLKQVHDTKRPLVITQLSKKYPGRFELWHVKDLSDELRDATLGEGNVDFAPIFKNEEISGMKYFFIEQDSSRKRTPIENIKISRDYLFSNVF